MTNEQLNEIERTYNDAANDHDSGWGPLGEWANVNGSDLVAEVKRLKDELRIKDDLLNALHERSKGWQ